MSMTLGMLAAGSPPAGGAPTGEVLFASASAAVLTSGLLALGYGYRSGRGKALRRLAALSERWSNLPAWAALPAGTASIALIIALFGMYWDVSLHIDNGRDPGPLANPAHYFILFGLYGIFTAGFMAIVLPEQRPGPAAIRITREWHAPLGGVLLLACGGFALIGFPLDDFWHQLFGQDVTLWGPTHLMLIGGAAMTLFAMAVLLVEGRRFNSRGSGARREHGWVRVLISNALPGAMLIGLSTFQGEFDFGVPQFRLIFHPMLIMFAAGVALVLARVWIGRGAALGAVAFFLIMRSGLALLVGPILGQTTPHFALFIVEAGIVELVALAVSPARPLAFGAASGALIGTVGLAAEWGWSHIWMPIPWPATMLPEAALLGFACALGGALIGAWGGARLRSDVLPRGGPLRVAAALGAVAVVAMIGYGLQTPPARGPLSASIVLHDVNQGPKRTVQATVTLTPRNAAHGAQWLTATAWQGGGFTVQPLRRIADGVYSTTRPIPVYGNWKTLIRLHRGSALMGVPVYLPADAAIPVAGVPATRHIERAFTTDHKILQREARTGAALVTLGAYLAVALIAALLLGMLAWGLHRLAVTASAPRSTPPQPRRARVRELTPTA